MSVRRLVVEVDVEGLNVTRFCDEHGISTWFFYDLRRRHARGESIEPRSTAPRTVANRTPDHVEDLIVAKRKELADAGLDAGPASIKWHLEHDGIEVVPSESTIWRMLKDRGLIVPEPRKAPKHAGKRFVAARANECWQLDDTSWVLADGSGVKILNVIDDHSRLLVASVAMPTATGAAALAALAEAATTLGWPARFQSDNAASFRFVLADALAELGVAARHSRPAHPQSNGKIERFHLTLQTWLKKQPAAATLTELQTQLDIFRTIYNHQRPHRAVNRQRPAEVWTAAPKTGPSNRPLGTQSKLYRGIVDGGTLRLGDRYRVTVGAQHNRERAIAIVTGLNCHIFVKGRLARALPLDPTRVDQPLYDRPGRPLP